MLSISQAECLIAAKTIGEIPALDADIIFSEDLDHVSDADPEISDICLDVENDDLVPSAFIKLDRIPLNINGKIEKSQIRTMTVLNTILPMMDDFMAEAMVQVMEKDDKCILIIFHSGYYSRKMMKTLAETYKMYFSEIISCAHPYFV